MSAADHNQASESSPQTGASDVARTDGAAQASYSPGPHMRDVALRLAQSLKLLNVGVFDVDFLSGDVFWSDEHFRLLGLEPGSITPTRDSFFDLIHPDDRQRNIETMDRAIAGEGALDDTHRVVRPDGSVRWMRGTGVVRRDAEGRPVGLMGLTIDVTEPMQAGRARHESNRRLAGTLAALGAGVWEIDALNGGAFWSDDAYRLYGLEPGEVPASFQKFLELVHPDDRQSVATALDRGIAADETVEVEHRLPLAGGVRWLRHIGVAQRDDAGRAISVWGITLDVTERHEAQAAELRARERAQRLGEAQAELSRVLAASATTDDAIPRVLEVFGRNLEWDAAEAWLIDDAADVFRHASAWGREGLDISTAVTESRAMVIRRGIGFIGRVWESGVPVWEPDLPAQLNAIVRKSAAVRLGLHTAFAVPVRRRGHIVGSLTFYSQQRKEPDQDVINIFGSLGNQLGEFMERVAAVDAMRASERRMRGMVNTSLDAVIAVDDAGAIVEWNPTAERMFGWSADEVLGRLFNDIIVPHAARRIHQRGLHAGMASIMNRRLELEALHRDGHTFPIEISVSELRPALPERKDTPPRPGASFGAFIRDISDRRRAEQALRQAKEQAEATARARSEFLAVMSHEIRTPLNGVIGMISLLLKTDLSSAQREQLLTARRSADVLLAVTNDALDFSKIEAGRLVVEQTPFDLDQLLDDVIGTVRPQVASGVDLAVVSHGYRPGAVLGDPTRLRQVLVNLVGNAAKFTKHGFVHLCVESSEAQADGAIPFRFLIEDTGIGIPADKHHDIFEAFAQAESSTTRRFGGTGLGLPIAKQLAQLMGGALRLVDSTSAGSIFELALPLKPATLARTKSAGHVAVSVSGHVLVVDDNQVNRDIASAMLRHAGCTVDVATGGAEALARIAAAPYDLVFMDCQMPDMDGYETTRELRRLGHGAERLPVVAMTAAALAEDRERSLAAGMNDHLSKPVLEDALLTVLARWLPHTSIPVPDLEVEPADDARQAPTFNLQTVRRTREIMEDIPGSWEAMVTSFVTHGNQMLERLAVAVTETRFDEVRRQAHNMKGTAALIGALRLSAWSADLEQAAQEGRTMLCGRLVPKLRDEFDAVTHALQHNAFD